MRNVRYGGDEATSKETSMTFSTSAVFLFLIFCSFITGENIEYANSLEREFVPRYSNYMTDWLKIMLNENNISLPHPFENFCVGTKLDSIFVMFRQI